MPGENPLPKLIQSFFLERLQSQQGLSANTVASYRDTLRLWMGFVEKQTRRTPSQQRLEDWNGQRVLAFLKWLEQHRHCAVRTRNQRLAALRAFMRHVDQCQPEAVALTQRILAIPMKRFDRPLLGYLSGPEVQAILAATDPTSANGQRDHLLLSLLYNTGARISEVLSLQRQHVRADAITVIQLMGKGRKQRAVPLWKPVARQLLRHLANLPPSPDAALFTNRFGHRLSRSGFAKRLGNIVRRAQQHCASLRGRSISPHTFRHSTAMHLLEAQVDITVIALLLGHESPATTHHYIELDLKMKERTLQKIRTPRSRSPKFKPGDKLLAFLESL